MYPAFVAILCGCIVAGLLYFLVASPESNSINVYCRTHGAQLIQSTHDNDLHITFWCVKNGKLVP